jgi:predicted DNA-binding transcriptional regulator AlpA
MKKDKDAFLPATGYVRLPTILALIPVSKSTFWAKVKTGEYPSAYKLGPNITAWRAEDIRALIDSFSVASGAPSQMGASPETSMKEVQDND